MDYLIYNLADAHLHELADTALLSDEERAAAQKRGERYVLTRCLLRRELARRLGRAPQDIRLCYNPQGKPECEGGGIHFNLSHSGDCLALVFDTQSPVGIDVERVRPRARLGTLAARIMCPEQLTNFRSRGCPAEEFYTCWCAAEALVKQAGSSIWQAQAHPFLCHHGRIELQAPTEVRLRVQAFCPMPGHAGAVAFIPQGMAQKP